MNSKINGLPPLGATPDVLLSAPRRNPEGVDASAPGAVRDADRLELTASARLLSDTVSGSDGAPVDVQRVARLREAVTQGTYRVDAGRIATRLLEAAGAISKDS